MCFSSFVEWPFTHRSLRSSSYLASSFDGWWIFRAVSFFFQPDDFQDLPLIARPSMLRLRFLRSTTLITCCSLQSLHSTALTLPLSVSTMRNKHAVARASSAGFTLLFIFFRKAKLGRYENRQPSTIYVPSNKTWDAFLETSLIMIVYAMQCIWTKDRNSFTPIM